MTNVRIYAYFYPLDNISRISAKYALRSDPPTALLDRNLASQLLDGGLRDRSKRHIF
jgi:hypothetical protein